MQMDADNTIEDNSSIYCLIQMH